MIYAVTHSYAQVICHLASVNSQWANVCELHNLPTVYVYCCELSQTFATSDYLCCFVLFWREDPASGRPGSILLTNYLLK